MYFYFLLYLFPCFLYFLIYNNRFKELQNIILISVLIIFTVIFSLRGEVGGDWKLYEFKFDRAVFDFNFLFFLKKEFSYRFATWFFSTYTGEISAFYFFLAIIYFFCTYFFCTHLERPLLAFIISIPIGVYLINIGFIRQSSGLAFLFLSLILFERDKFFKSLLLFFIAITFHFSSIVFLPIFIFGFIKLTNIFKKYLIFFIYIIYFLVLIGIIFLIFYLRNLTTLEVETLPIPQNIKGFINAYVVYRWQYGTIMESKGVYIRLLPFIFSILFFMYLNFYRLININQILSSFFVFLFLLVLISFYFGYSTLADRLCMYSLPFQMYIFTNTRHIFNSDKNKFLVDILVCLSYLLLLSMWLVLSHDSFQNWQPFTLHYPFL